ncbi:MAG: hypothetical protein H7A45_11405 [Verrucomicrobiales bacterium]|nr:hypothetical protein [Verrucomicrobiales bacterium]MCP5526028.1 hypothetical protein [Verrucomicrobiales bacterium]
MNDDPIVEEVRRARDELARRFNYDIHSIFADLRRGEGNVDPGRPLVSDAREWAPARGDLMTLREEPGEPSHS